MVASGAVQSDGSHVTVIGRSGVNVASSNYCLAIAVQTYGDVVTECYWWDSVLNSDVGGTAVAVAVDVSYDQGHGVGADAVAIVVTGSTL